MARGGLREKGVVKEGRPGEPLFSVITVVLNGAEFLEQALQSVLLQDYRNIEYIVLDGGSTDGTLDILRRYDDRLDYWVSGPDNGIYDAMNKGLALVRGDYVGFLGVDDFYEPDSISAVACAAAADPAADLIYGHTWVVREDFHIRYRSRSGLDYRRGMSIGHQAMFVRRGLLVRRGGFDTRYRIAADYDFLVEALTSGVRVAAIDAFLVNYRDSGVSARQMRRSMAEARRILARRRGVGSADHLFYILLFMKSMVLVATESVLRKLVGSRLTDRLRQWYLFSCIARERETY